MDNSPLKGRIYPGPPKHDPRDAMSMQSWGFQDTTFAVDETGAITVTGDRYPGLSGERLPDLLPWFRKVVGIDFPLEPGTVTYRLPPVPDPKPAGAFIEEISRSLAGDQITTDPATRLRHGHGHTVSEINAVRTNGFERIPDYVVYPRDEDQVAAIVRAAFSPQ